MWKSLFLIRMWSKKKNISLFISFASCWRFSGYSIAEKIIWIHSKLTDISPYLMLNCPHEVVHKTTQNLDHIYRSNSFRFRVSVSSMHSKCSLSSSFGTLTSYYRIVLHFFFSKKNENPITHRSQAICRYRFTIFYLNFPTHSSMATTMHAN